ncbi:MAG: class I SAM-dependent methyltransferase [Bacteroidetes bacterium]|nr:class I SAM-dependent methyltransferase [Bacteroidota bacterium]
MRLRYIVPLAAFLTLGLAVKRSPGERQVRVGAIEDREAAATYREVSNYPHFRFFRWLVARHATQGRSGGQILDVGSGPGWLAIQIAFRGPAWQVTGIDPSEEMVRLAAENARRRDLEGRVNFSKGTAESIPFPDGSFDVVVSTLSLHHWTDPAAGLREIGRVLKPGGRFIVLDLRRDLAILVWLILNLVQRLVLPPALRRVGEPRGSALSAYTPDEAANMAVQAGLRDWQVSTGPAWLMIEGTKG